MLDYVLPATMISQKLRNAAVIGEVILELREVLEVRTGESIDCLPVVADAEQRNIGATLKNNLNKTIEQFREVLVLINENVFDIFYRLLGSHDFYFTGSARFLNQITRLVE